MTKSDVPDPEKTKDENPNDSITTTIREEIANALGKLFDSGATVTDAKEKSNPKSTDKQGSISDEVRAELERIRQADKEATDKQSIQSELERLKGLVENPPVTENPSKLQKFLWGGK